MKESTPQSESKRHQRVTTLRRFSSGLALVLAVAVTVTFINSAYSVPEPVQATPYDGLTLYRGLFFASGPVASRIPTIRKAAPYFPAGYKSLEGQIIKYIQAKDPNYFDSFAKEIQSGDRVRVAKAIQRTNKLQKQALLEVTKNSKTQFAGQVRRSFRNSDPDTDNDVAVDIAIAIEAVVAVAAFLVLIVVFAKVQPSEQKGLRFEQYVNEIVTTLPRARADVMRP